MNKTSRLLTLGAALLLAPLNSTFAQSTWETVHYFQYAPGKRTSPIGIIATPDGAIFVSGAGNDAANLQHRFVNRSLDGGATWDLVLDLIGNTGAYCCAVAATPSGVLWSTTDTFRLTPAGGANASGHTIVRKLATP